MASNYLCKLQDGTVVRQGTKVFRTDLGVMVTAKSMYQDMDGDRFLCYEEGGNSWIDGPSYTWASQKVRGDRIR